MRILLLALLIGWTTCSQAIANFDAALPLPENIHMDVNAAKEDNHAFEPSAFFTPTRPEGKQLYTTLSSMPEQVFRGEIFTITLRSVVTAENIDSLQYRFEKGYGATLLSPSPQRRRNGRTYYDTFYFKATAAHLRLPDITPMLVYGFGYTVDSETLPGQTINATVLNPPNDFCGLLASDIALTHTKTSVYDPGHNIVIFSLDANRSDLHDFRLPQAISQNFESLKNGPRASNMTYFAVVPKRLSQLQWRYFNLNSRTFESVRIPIAVSDDSVSTMSDLTPKAHGHTTQKAIAIAILSVILTLLALWRRSWIVFSLGVLAGAYAAWLSIPLKQVCIEKGAKIFLLPMHNATVFETAPLRYNLEVQGHVKGYTKVRLHNNKIGWIKNEDTCTH